MPHAALWFLSLSLHSPNKYPGSDGCTNALRWCDPEPIKTKKDSCVQIKIGRPVKYNDTDGTCAYDPNPPKDNHYMSIYVSRKPQHDFGMYMSCDPVTAAGAKSAVAAMRAALGHCDVPTTILYEIVVPCRDGSDKFDVLEAAARKACASAAHPGTGNTTFLARR